MFTCVYCGWQATNELARICIDCGPEKNWPLNQIDLPESIANYQRSVRELFFAGASEEEISRFSLQLRSRLKISFSFEQTFLPILKKERQRAAQLGKFRIEFDENVTDAYAGHDTYLRFRLTNLSDVDFFSFNLDWDDPETPDELDLHIQSRQPVKPSKSLEIGGSHIFARMGVKDISDLQITVTNQFQDSAIFRAESFTFKVSNPDQQITNLTHNQISIEGRGVVDASGMGAQPNSSQNRESWTELKFDYIAGDSLPSYLDEELRTELTGLTESRRQKEEQERVELARLEQERRENEELERQEAARLERERQEKEERERLETVRLEQERREKEERRQKEEQEKQEAARLEWARIEKEQEERHEASRLKRERPEKEEKERQEAVMLRLQHEVRLERESEEERLAAKAAEEAERARAYQEQKQKEKEANWKKLRESKDSSSNTQPSGARRSNVSKGDAAEIFNPVEKNEPIASDKNLVWWGIFGLVALIWGIVKFGINPPQPEMPYNPPASVSSDPPGTGGADVKAVDLPWDGGVYTGTVSATGVPHGKGTLDWSSTCTGDCVLSYKGQFEYGECRGKGTLRMTGGDKFVGQFTTCNTGKGTYTYANGTQEYARLVNGQWK